MTSIEPVTIELEQLESYPSLGDAHRMRVRTAAGHATTLHVASWSLAAFRIDLVPLDPPSAVERWCREHAHGDAINGGFFTKPLVEPLGEVVVDGKVLPTTPMRTPWSRIRGSMMIDRAGAIQIAARSALPATIDGSLLQAGPLLVAAGDVVVDASDPEGFSTTSDDEFDSDITAEPLPRMAIARTHDERMLAVAVDGRSDEDDGLLLPELAAVLVELGASDALNLDGGTSASLVTAGVRRNHPRDDSGTLFTEGYITTSVLVVRPR